MRPVDRLETQFGTMFHFADDEVIGRSLRLYGQWAIDEVALCARVLGHAAQTGDFVDLGANVGSHTVAIASLFPERQTFSFEANPPTFRLLSSNVLVNGLGNVNTFNCLVGEDTRLCRAAINEAAGPKNLGATSFDIMPVGDVSGKLMLEARVDDAFPPDRVAAMVKVDVEGMDLSALLGARAMLERCRPAIYYENGTQEQSGPLFDLLRSLGYETFWHVNFPFDALNFRGETQNIFGRSVEIATLCVHSDSTDIDYFRDRLTITDQKLDDRAWAQCLSINSHLRTELRARWAARRDVGGFRALLLARYRGKGGDVLEQGAALPPFGEVRRATLLDFPTETLKSLLVPYIEAAPFDEAAYLTRYPDVAAAVGAGQFASVRQHYVSGGYFEGRSP